MNEVACRFCGLDPLCSLLDYAESGSGVPPGVLVRRRPIVRGEVICRQGEPFTSLFAVKSGSFKAVENDAAGNERVVGFYLTGELMGAEGMASGGSPNTLVALEDSQLCDLRMDRLEASGRRHEQLQQRIVQLLSQQVAFRHDLISSLTYRRADQRVCAFLLSLSERLRTRGLPNREIGLAMSQFDIGDFLGLSNATVSRILTQMQKRGAIEVLHRKVRILDQGLLREIVA